MKHSKLLGSGNSKLNKTAKKFDVKILNFSIPAYKSQTGKITCPFAKDCVKFCYAQKGAYAWSNTQAALERRFEATKQDNFVNDITAQLKGLKTDKQIYVRIHDSGDFYSPAYIKKWFDIARLNPLVRFYGYTKSIKLFMAFPEDTPANMDIIYSEGSKSDDYINTALDRHARIFDSIEELNAAGYNNASEYDLEATKWHNKNNKVGLVLH